MKSFRNVNLGLGFAASNIARRKTGTRSNKQERKQARNCRVRVCRLEDFAHRERELAPL